jgi:hypothetical protein
MENVKIWGEGPMVQRFNSSRSSKVPGVWAVNGQWWVANRGLLPIVPAIAYCPLPVDHSLPLLTNEQEAQVCDARDDDSGNYRR